MTMAAVANICVGVLLAQRFTVFILFPAMIVNCAVVGGTGLIWEIGLSQIVLEIAALSTALQLGYVAPLYRSC
jgi:hypothetical protein